MHRISSDSSYDGHAKRQLAIREMTESIQKLHTDVQTLGTSLFRVAAAVEDIQFHTRHTYQVLTKTNPSQRGTLPLTGAVSLATVTFANRDDEHCGDTSTAPGDEIARPAFSAQRLVTPPLQQNLPSPYPQQTMSLVSAVSTREALVKDIDHLGSVEKSHAAFAVRSPSYYWSEDRHNSQGSGQDSSKGAREGGVWPSNVKLRKPLEADKNTISKEQAREKLAQTKGSKKLLKKSAQDGPGSSGGCSRLIRVQDPNSRLVAFYEILSVLAFINDLAVTPYVVAWEVQEHPKIMAMNCISVLYWTLALIVKCRTGFYEGGELKLDQRAIIRHYARTSLVPDTILVAIDWFVLVWRWTQDSSSRSLRFTKLFRITKVLRLAHVWRLMEKALRTSGYFSDATLHKLAVRLGQVVLSTILFVHIMCCAWYHVGLRGDTDTGDHWLRTATNPLEEVPETWQFNDNVFLYMTSFHWTLATITLGAMEVSPTNSLERIFCISLLLVGMIFNATIVSLISSQTMTYVQMQREKNATMHTLTRFLDQNMVDAKLQTRVRRQVLDRLSASSFHISEDNVPALAMLSTDLRKQLLNRTRAKYLLTHALFRTWAGADSAAFHAMCDEESGPLKFRTFKTQDYVFLPGMEADGAMLVLQGKLRYMLDISGTDVEPEFAVHGAWLAEAALWAHWVHVGRLESEGPSQLLLVEVTSFLAIVQRFELAGYLSRGYGRAFHSRIISAGPPFSKYPTDLEVPNTDPSDLLTQDVGLDLLNRERVNKDSKLAEISESAFKELVEEVTAEKCSIVQGSDGELERCVALVAVKITREDEIRIFVEVGTWDPDTDVVKPMCALPAKKRGRGELPNSAFDNILSSHLKVMREHLSVVPGMTTTEVEVKDSPQFALKTKYVRTVLQVEVDSEFDFQSLPVVSHPFRSMYREGGPGGMIKRRSSMGSSSSHGHYEELSLQDVYILPGDGNKRRLYAWLMPRTIERLRAEGSGRSELEKWLKSIEFPALRPGATANCTDWHPDASRDMDDSRTATFEVVEDDEEDPGVEDIDLI